MLLAFGDPRAEVADHLGEARALPGVHLKHGAADASEFMLARGLVGTPAGSQLDPAEQEVLLEVCPFLVGGLAVFLCGPGGPAAGQERLVVADQGVLEHGKVVVGSPQVLVSEDFGGNVDGQPAGDGIGREDPPEVMGRVLDWLACGVEDSGPLDDACENAVDVGAGKGLPAPALSPRLLLFAAIALGSA